MEEGEAGAGPFLSDDAGTKPAKEERVTWGNRLEFILASIGFAVGISTIWRFPILFVRNGGGAFLIPFVIVFVVIGGPLYHLEVNLGQFTGKAPTKAFEYCPLFKGTGFLMIAILLIVTWHYMTIMAWIVYYLYSSLGSTLPWSSCNNPWNTEHCREGIMDNTSTISHLRANDSSSAIYTTPALEFWLRNVLGKSSGLEELGPIQPHLAICLVIAWALTTLCIIKGIKSVGKVVYITVLLPYVLLTIILIRALTLDGSLDGVRFCLDIRLDKLTDPQVWLDASVMAFYSLGPVWGTVITMASHNKFTQPNFRDTVAICVIDSASALFASAVVFSILGFMAKKEGIPIEELASASGPGLAFVAYPTAVTYLPLPQLWAVLFFVMLLLVMLDSAFAMFEAVVESITDLMPHSQKYNPAVLKIGFAVCMCALGLVFTTKGGIYLFQLMDWYSTAFAMVMGAFLEVTSLALIYGVDRFSHDITLMGGRPISRVGRCLYCIVIPITTLMTFVLMLARYREPYYGDGYKYKPYAIAAGIFVGLVPILVVLGFAIMAVASQKGYFLQKVKRSLRPSDQWMPQDETISDTYQTNPYKYSGSVIDRFKTNLCGSQGTPWL